MVTGGSGIALGCTSCDVQLFLLETEETAVRAQLAAFFVEHTGCQVFMDVSRTAIPLPRRSPDELRVR